MEDDWANSLTVPLGISTSKFDLHRDFRKNIGKNFDRTGKIRELIKY